MNNNNKSKDIKFKKETDESSKNFPCDSFPDDETVDLYNEMDRGDAQV